MNWLLFWLVLGGWLIGALYAARFILQKEGRLKDFSSYSNLGIVCMLWPIILLGLAACTVFAGLGWLLARLAVGRPAPAEYGQGWPPREKPWPPPPERDPGGPAGLDPRDG